MVKRFAFRRFSDSWQLNLWWFQINHYPPLSRFVPGSKVRKHTHLFFSWRSSGVRLPF